MVSHLPSCVQSWIRGWGTLGPKSQLETRGCPDKFSPVLGLSGGMAHCKPQAQLPWFRNLEAFLSKSFNLSLSMYICKIGIVIVATALRGGGW